MIASTTISSLSGIAIRGVGVFWLNVISVRFVWGRVFASSSKVGNQRRLSWLRTQSL